jgi:protein-S-isoprenylcysteine O-methyltransferase Ste14
MAWLWLRSLFYLAAVGGVWLVVFPAVLLQCDPIGSGLRLRPCAFAAAGAALFGLGTTLALWSGAWLIHDGGGTPFPLDPTRRLVTAGPYAVVRNPQAIALLLLTCGEALAVDSPALCLLPLLAVLFLIGLAEPFEDWELRRRFGRAYEAYRARVPRWLPRTPRGISEGVKAHRK